jgi:hypothetical protein
VKGGPGFLPRSFLMRAALARGRRFPRSHVRSKRSTTSTIQRRVKRRREGEDLDPKPSTGRKRRILATSEKKQALWKPLEENDEATLGHHCGCG